MSITTKVNNLIEQFSVITLVKGANVYSVYVLFLLLFGYLLNQLDRYILAIVNLPLSQELHYGDKGCLANTSIPKNITGNATCKDVTPEDKCLHVHSPIDPSVGVCTWDYDGQGVEYEILAGPVFILIYTIMGVVVGVAADRYNRVILLAISLAFWSAMTLLTGFVNEYWQLVVLRFGLGLGEAGCTPFASSLISQYFSAELRASAMSVYNWGIYTGYSLSYAIGNSLSITLGWRYAFYISGAPGILLALIIFITMREPVRQTNRDTSSQARQQVERPAARGRCYQAFKPYQVMLRPSAIILLLAGSIRNAGGYVWAYNTQPYFESIGQTADEIVVYMSWIPLVGGSLGVVVGGFISDKLVKNRGTYARVWVLVISQVVATPFAAGALFLEPPYCYISLIPANIIGEMWVGVTLTVVVELFPISIRTTSVAIYLFVITNIGGNIPLLIPPLKQMFLNIGYTDTQSLRGALYLLYPGMYLLGSILFMFSLVVLKRDISKIQKINDSYQTLSEEYLEGENEVGGSQPPVSVNTGVNGESQEKNV